VSGNYGNSQNIKWQKVGTPRSIFLDGTLRGCMEEFVLYAYNMNYNSPQKTDWRLHQYRIRDRVKDGGELVVSKIFHQLQNKFCELAENNHAESELVSYSLFHVDRSDTFLIYSIIFVTHTLQGSFPWTRQLLKFVG
jgi:hypothetical protein